MDQYILNFIFIGLSFALYIGIAIRSRATSTKEYYVAGGGRLANRQRDGDGR